MDREDVVPVRTEGSGTKYDGRVWYEQLESIKTLNNIPVTKQLVKADLKHGDKVTIEYEGKTFAGIIDYGSDSSPALAPGSRSPPSEQQGTASQQDQLPNQETPKRKRKSVARLVDEKEFERAAPSAAKKPRKKKKEG